MSDDDTRSWFWQLVKNFLITLAVGLLAVGCVFISFQFPDETRALIQSVRGVLAPRE